MAKKSLIVLLEIFLLIFCCTSCGEMEHGTISANGYINQWAGIFVPIKNGWNCLYGQELADYLGVDYDASASDAEADKGVSYEFRMEKDGGFPSLTLTFEYIDDKKVSADDYLSSVEAGLESDTEVAFSCLRGSKVKIAGEKYESLYVMGTYGESTVSEQYFARKIGDYMMCFVAVDIGTDTTETDVLIGSITKS